MVCARNKWVQTWGKGLEGFLTAIEPQHARLGIDVGDAVKATQRRSYWWGYVTMRGIFFIFFYFKRDRQHRPNAISIGVSAPSLSKVSTCNSLALSLMAQHHMALSEPQSKNIDIFRNYELEGGEEFLSAVSKPT